MPFCDQVAALETHNRFRALHGAPPLLWSIECAVYAQKAATENQKSGEIHHCFCETKTTGRKMGQSIMWSSEEEKKPEEAAVKFWYSEFEDPGYNFAEPGYQAGTGQFSALVWYNTTHVGMSKSEDGRFVVANYYPAGNLISKSQFQKNVLPLNTPFVFRPRNKVEKALFVQFEALARGRDTISAVELQQMFVQAEMFRYADAAAVADQDGDGLVDPREFVMAMAHPRDSDEEESLDRIIGFVQADKDGDMKVDREELALFLRNKTCKKYTQEEVTELLVKFDTDNDGVLDYRELEKLLQSGAMDGEAPKQSSEVASAPPATPRDPTPRRPAPVAAHAVPLPAKRGGEGTETENVDRPADEPRTASLRGMTPEAEDLLKDVPFPDVVEAVKQCLNRGGYAEIKRTAKSIEATLEFGGRRGKLKREW